MIFNIPNKKPDENFQTVFYEIGQDFSMKKVFQIDEGNGFFSISSVKYLSRGLIYTQKKDGKNVIYIMDDNFNPKEIYRFNPTTIYNYEPVFIHKTKGFIYVSDGTFLITDGQKTESKVLIVDGLPFQNIGGFIKITQKLNIGSNGFYFTLLPRSIFGKNLWITDGTIDGTIQLLKNNGVIPPESNVTYSNEESMGLFGNRYIFKKLNDDLSKYELWMTEGTIETTKKLKDFQGNDITRSVYVNGYYQDVNYNIKQWESLKKINNKLYFSRFTPETGYEPWQTDGTPEGTKMLGDLVKGFQSSDPYQFVEINQNPYCIATETNKAQQLWAFCDVKATISAENNLPINSKDVKLIANQNNDWKYQWLWNGSAIEKATLTTFKAQYSGTYRVKVEDKIGCISVSDSIIVKFAQSILANEPFTNEFALKIYPNPSQNDLNVYFEGKNQENFEITVYDLSGRMMINQAVESNLNNIISTKQLNTGTYFLRLSNGEKQVIQKIVKE